MEATLTTTPQPTATAEADAAPSALTPNQVVAVNLRRAREVRGLTQEQAAERLEPFIGKRWSKASFSAAERSATSDRVREFTIDELIAFARCFELTPAWFLAAPAGATEIAVPGPARNQQRDDYMAMVAGGTVARQRAADLENAMQDARSAMERVDRLNQQIFGRYLPEDEGA